MDGWLGAGEPICPWKKSSGRLSTAENLRFSRVLRTRDRIPAIQQAVYPQPAIPDFSLVGPAGIEPFFTFYRGACTRPPGGSAAFRAGEHRAGLRYRVRSTRESPRHSRGTPAEHPGKQATSRTRWRRNRLQISQDDRPCRTRQRRLRTTPINGSRPRVCPCNPTSSRVRCIASFCVFGTTLVAPSLF